jgi:hypothetical protein
MKKFILLSCVFYSTFSFSCQKLKGQIQINKYKIPIDHKCLQNQIFSITNNSYYVHLKLNGKILDVKIDQMNKNQRDKILATELMFHGNKELKLSAQSNENNVKINLNLLTI